METMVEPQAQRRLTLVAWLGVLWGAILFARLIQLHVIENESLSQVARTQQEHTVEVPAARGAIYSGGDGASPLAISVPVRRVAINPLRIQEGGEEFVTTVLATLLGLDSSVLLRDIREARNPSDGRPRNGYLVIREDATNEEINRLRNSKLDIFTFENTYRREYPKGSLASHVLGWVNKDGHGDAGVERGLETELAGVPGRMHMLRDSRNRDYYGELVNEEKPEPGVDITLTIDEAIQYAAEKALKKAVEDEKVPSGTVVVLNPKNGDILAMASYPSFDPRVNPQNENEMLERLNLTIAAPFEPGSVFKAITIAAALETTNLRPTTIINCGNGILRMPGRVVHDHDAYAALPMTGVLANSSNIGAINIGLTVGNKRMHAYMEKFGFGSRVGVPLPGESGGKVHPVRDWTAGSMGSIAMGHEMTATPLQLAQAFGIIANNGTLIHPRIVKARRHHNSGKTDIVPPAEPDQRIKAETAIELRRMLEQVVLEGTGKAARLKKGYTVAGKTGTAQMVDARTGKYLHRYNSSFVGFGPVADPAIVVAVTLNGSYKYGGVTAGPVFREVAGSALRTLGIRKDLIEEEEPVKQPEGKPEPVAPPQLASVKPAAPPEPEDPALVHGPRVPDFQGMTMRAVMAKSVAEGWHVETVGKGIARVQEPAPGALVASGKRVRIVFRP
ncbi:MAG TPA: penicillin-binding transpeptidase domain-containing protein [Bryobacteraceae bacterium]|nr:penicillin-binding transpeptidase domain-containing protein [Bryobacteraceae bacterium]